MSRDVNTAGSQRNKEDRAAILMLVKSALQRYYDDGVIDRQTFVTVCKQTLEWIIASPPLRDSALMFEDAAERVVRPLIDSQLSALGCNIGLQRSKSEQQQVTATNEESAVGRSRVGRDAATSRAFDDAYQQSKDLFSRHVRLHEWTDGAPSAIAAAPHGAAERSAAERSAATGAFNSSCTNVPIDPEELVRRRHRLAAARRHAAVEGADDAALRVAPHAASTGIDAAAITALLQQLYQQQRDDMHLRLDMLERRQLLFLDEQNERQLTGNDEASAWVHLTGDVARAMLLSTQHKERVAFLRQVLSAAHDVTIEEEDERAGLLFEFSEEEVRISTALQQRAAADAAAAAEALRAQQEEETQDAPPPPPTTPKPSRQFDTSDDSVDLVDVATLPPLLQAQWQALTQLRAAVHTVLTSNEREVLELRVASLEQKLAAKMKQHSSKAGERPPKPAVHEHVGLVATPLRGAHSVAAPTQGAACGSTSRRTYQPFESTTEHTPRRPATPLPSPRSATRSGIQRRSAQLHNSNSVHSKADVQQPTRDEVVEFLRSLLQPAYDAGVLAQAVFVDIVKCISKRFSDQSWITLALQRETTSRTGSSRRIEPLWKAYLRRELDDIFGDEARSLLT